MTRTKYLFLVLLAFVFLSGCAHYQDVRPETPRQAYVAAENQFQGFVATASSLRERGILDDAKYEKLLEIFEVTETSLESVFVLLRQGHETEAEDRLAFIRNLLWQITDIIAEVER